MARKKKEKETLNFTPSKYQEAIFDYVEKGQGHLVVEACACAGKTSTLLKCLELIPPTKKILFTAFNQDIVKELKKRTKDIDNVDVRTLHSLGLLFLRRNLEGEALIPDTYKYESHIRANIKQYTTINTYALKSFSKYLENIKKYVDFGRFYLCQNEKELEMIEMRYGIDTIADEKEIALKVMEWGKTSLDTVDYTDMIWLPHVLFLKPLGLLYDFIMVDEAQDMNMAERELVLKCFKMGTRMISVGDENQCIYSFSGSDPNSFSKLKSLPNTISLPLSISYRCAKNIVNYAKRLVPSIESNDDGREGFILKDVQLEDIKDGDMVICRNNAPLFQTYNAFLKLGKNVFIRGKEIGSNLKSVVKSTKQTELNADCHKDGVFTRLYDDLFITRNKIMERFGIDEDSAMKSPIFLNKLDMIKALEVLAEGIKTSEEIIEKIDNIFSKKNKTKGIALSTIHKAKGLEADNVYIVSPSLMPSKSATKDWEIKQERNLMYVAYTRPRNILGFVDEKDFEKFDFTNSNSIKALKNTEVIVNRTLNKSTKVIINKDTAKIIVLNAKNIDKNVSTTTTVNINKVQNKRHVNSFADLLKNKNKKKH